MSWHDELRPASFRGIPFKIDVNARSSGRRGITYEFPKRDDTLDEDMGRRARRKIVSGYVIGPDYQINADDLEYALEREGGGLLVLPIMGQATMRCEAFTRVERKELGGYAAFEMTFVASGAPTFSLFTEDTQRGVETASGGLADAAEMSAGKPSSWKGGT